MLITIGAFDGFHKGHKSLFDICRENSDGNSWGVVTFQPHPSFFMGRLRKTLFTLPERKLLRAVLGIPKMFVFKFDDEMMRLSPEKFWQLLKSKINIDGLVMGSDFHFGHSRAGNTHCLEKLALNDGVKKVIIADLKNKSSYSSSRARNCIACGDVESTAEILGYPFFVFSKVIRGNQRGRTMKFPTANIFIDNDKMIPSDGVYSCAVFLPTFAQWYCGALSIGNNPTFHDVQETRAEVNILDFDRDIYGEEIAVILFRRLRGIQTFSSSCELSEQIANDVEQCRTIYDEMMPKVNEFSQKLGEYTTKKDDDECILIRTVI